MDRFSSSGSSINRHGVSPFFSLSSCIILTGSVRLDKIHFQGGKIAVTALHCRLRRCDSKWLGNSVMRTVYSMIRLATDDAPHTQFNHISATESWARPVRNEAFDKNNNFGEYQSRNLRRWIISFLVNSGPIIAASSIFRNIDMCSLFNYIYFYSPYIYGRNERDGPWANNIGQIISWYSDHKWYYCLMS